MFRKNTFNSITINGRKIDCVGNNVVIQNGKVIVDGKTVESDIEGSVEVYIDGNVDKIMCAGSVHVSGNCNSVDCGGSCYVNGDINGGVDAGGSVRCGNVFENIDAGGSVKYGG